MTRSELIQKLTNEKTLKRLAKVLAKRDSMDKGVGASSSPRSYRTFGFEHQADELERVIEDVVFRDMDGVAPVLKEELLETLCWSFDVAESPPERCFEIWLRRVSELMDRQHCSDCPLGIMNEREVHRKFQPVFQTLYTEGMNEGPFWVHIKSTPWSGGQAIPHSLSLSMECGGQCVSERAFTHHQATAEHLVPSIIESFVYAGHFAPTIVTLHAGSPEWEEAVSGSAVLQRLADRVPGLTLSSEQFRTDQAGWNLVSACVRVGLGSGDRRKNEMRERIRNGIHLLADSDASKRPVAKLVLSMAAVEALVGKGASGATERVARHAARLLVKESRARFLAKKEIEDLYNDRSRAVHGESISNAGNAGRATQARSLASGLLKAVLEWAQFRKRLGSSLPVDRKALIDELERAESGEEIVGVPNGLERTIPNWTKIAAELGL